MLVPCAVDEQQFYIKTAEELRTADASEKYMDLLFSDEGFDRRVGLYELAISYKAAVSADAVEDRAIRLTVDLALEPETD